MGSLWSTIGNMKGNLPEMRSKAIQRFTRTLLRGKTLSLTDVLDLSKKKFIDKVHLDKRTGKGWASLTTIKDGFANNSSIAFHFPPNDSFRLVDSLRKHNQTMAVEFVNRMDFVGDLSYVVPKALISMGMVIALRASLLGILHIVEQQHATPTRGLRAKTPPVPRPANSHNSWAISRLKPIPPTMRKGSSNRIVTFKDVAGLHEAKQELSELVHFLKDPERYHAMGAHIPRGALLSGPPGTGKTLLAKAVAGEAKVPFFSLSGSDFMEVYVGIGAARVRELFAEARRCPHGAILFIDEVDAIGRKRSAHAGSGASHEAENTLNQLLIEMDGFNSNENVVVIAASNRCETLDNALTRPGRFDRTIECVLPSVKDRQCILSCHMENVKLDVTDKDLDSSRPFEDYQGMMCKMNKKELAIREAWCSRIAALTPGFSGADLSNLVNEAAILAARNNRQGVLLRDIEESVERTAFGLEKGGELPTKERMKKTAFHEAGHAILGWVLPNADPPIKLSIVPRKSGVLGYAQQIPDEESLDTRDNIRDKLAVLMGGRVAEEIMFGQGSTGAEDDIAKATMLGRAYVSAWGFAPNEAGIMSITSHKVRGQYKPSQKTLTMVDDAVENLLKEAKQRAKDVINDNFDAFQRLAIALCNQETLTYRDLLDTIGVPPSGKNSETFKHYLKHELGGLIIDPSTPVDVTQQQQ